MADIPTAKEITDLAGLLVPGILILGIRSRFRDVSAPSLSDKILNYAVVSVAYNAAAYPLFHAENGVRLSVWFWQICLYVLLPTVVAATLVFFDRSEAFYRITGRLGLRPLHHDPTAWDHAFRRRPPSYVIVHLTDGSEVSGVWSDGAFASSTAGDRDILLEQVWEQGAGGWTIVDPPRSVLICGGTVRMVEFIRGGSE